MSSSIKEKDVEHLFDSIASRYDGLNRLLSARQDIRWRKALIKEASKRLPSEPWNLLDVATGTADLALALAKAAPYQSTIKGVDISANMLALGEKKIASSRLSSQVELQKMSAEKLSFADHSFDGASIAFGIRNVINKQAALKEFHRVLKPGSSVYVLEFFKPPRHLFSFLFQLYFKHVLPFIGGLFSNPEAYRYLPESVDRFESLEEFKGKLKEAGFSDFYAKTFLFGSCALVVGKKSTQQ